MRVGFNVHLSLVFVLVAVRNPVVKVLAKSVLVLVVHSDVYFD